MTQYPKKISNLFELGAVIEVEIYHSSDQANLLFKTYGLIDTGGLSSSIDNDLVQNLKIKQIGKTEIKGTSLEHEIIKLSLYNIGLAIAIPTSKIIDISVLGIDLSTELYKIIIGRDFLKHCIFIYNGTDNIFLLDI